MAKKTTCPITRATFREKAKPLKVVINGTEMDVDTKEFSTGSIGWFTNNKVTVDIGGVRVAVQANISLTIVGSKELPKDDESPSAPAPAQSS